MSILPVPGEDSPSIQKRVSDTGERTRDGGGELDVEIVERAGLDGSDFPSLTVESSNGSGTSSMESSETRRPATAENKGEGLNCRVVASSSDDSKEWLPVLCIRVLLGVEGPCALVLELALVRGRNSGDFG